MSLDHLLCPFQLRRLIVDLEHDTVLIDAATDVGSVQIDLHELHANGGTDLLGQCFDAGDKNLIDRFASATLRDFQ
jgi:hypothetical protein